MKKEIKKKIIEAWEKEFEDILYRLIKEQYFDCEIIINELSNKIGKLTYKPNFEDSKKLNTVFKILQNSHHGLADQILELFEQELKELLDEMEQRIPNVKSINPSYFRDVIEIFREKQKLKKVGY